MRKPEQKLYDAMKRNLPAFTKVRRVENPMDPGTPDVRLIYILKFERWVELKQTKRPKRPTTPLMARTDFQQEQPAWHIEHNADGLTSFILIRDDMGELYVVPGKHIELIYTIPHVDLHRMFSVPDWPTAFIMMEYYK